jgi:hypothetical protein
LVSADPTISTLFGARGVPMNAPDRAVYHLNFGVRAPLR